MWILMWCGGMVNMMATYLIIIVGNPIQHAL